MEEWPESRSASNSKRPRHETHVENSAAADLTAVSSGKDWTLHQEIGSTNDIDTNVSTILMQENMG